MTVAELIDELQRLPGDPDLRCVLVRVVVHRPYVGDTTMEARVTRVSISHDVVNLDAFGYLEL